VNAVERLAWLSRLAALPSATEGMLRVGITLAGHMNGQTGRCDPSTGTLALGVALHVAIEQGRPAAVLSLEMSSAELVERALAALARVPVHRLRSGRLSPDQWGAVTAASSPLHRAPLILDDTGGIRPSELQSRVRRIKRQ